MASNLEPVSIFWGWGALFQVVLDRSFGTLLIFQALDPKSTPTTQLFFASVMTSASTPTLALYSIHQGKVKMAFAKIAFAH